MRNPPINMKKYLAFRKINKVMYSLKVIDVHTYIYLARKAGNNDGSIKLFQC